MKWTTDKPTLDGWYWVKFIDNDNPVCLNIEIDRYPYLEPKGRLYYETNATGYECEDVYDLNYNAELFYGPITPPSFVVKAIVGGNSGDVWKYSIQRETE